MAIVIIKGKSKHISKEELRSMAIATSTVLEFHNKTPANDIGIIIIKISKRDNLGKNHLTGRDNAGIALRKIRTFVVIDRPFDEMFSTIIHEMIHLYIDFPDGQSEKLTSTLTHRLKPTITEIYDSLVKDIYKRAAYLAHCKISYKPKGKDFYDSKQWETVETSSIGKKYR